MQGVTSSSPSSRALAHLLLDRQRRLGHATAGDQHHDHYDVNVNDDVDENVIFWNALMFFEKYSKRRNNALDYVMEEEICFQVVIYLNIWCFNKLN